MIFIKKVLLVGDLRALQRMDSCEVGTPFLDEVFNTELPHSVQVVSFSDMALLIFLNQFVLL